MPIEIRHFGVGYRRPEGPPGTHGLAGQVIHSDGRGLITELAFVRGGSVAPHSNPNTTWFCVIEGGGWVIVGDERRRVAAGEAVLWPANIAHAAWTDQIEMRAIVVEFTGENDQSVLEIAGAARRLERGERPTIERGEGTLAPRERRRTDEDLASGEPL